MKALSPRNWLGSVVVLLLAVALWWLASHQQWVSKLFLPTPEDTLLSLGEGLRGGALLEQTLQTVRRMVEGWFVACLVGVLLGAVIGTSPVARAWLQPMLEFIRDRSNDRLSCIGFLNYCLSGAGYIQSHNFR